MSNKMPYMNLHLIPPNNTDNIVYVEGKERRIMAGGIASLCLFLALALRYEVM